jgi:Ser/Thr protein kinase RdoA (MazF antagonist)
MTDLTLVPPAPVVEAFGLVSDSLARASSGLINATWYARSRADDTQLVLQRVNSIFPPEVNLDIEAVTEHLASKGLATPRLLRSAEGNLWVEHEGFAWRVLTRVDGISRDALETPRQAREAGRVLAEFHRAVADLDYTFRNARAGVHDTARHLAALRTALAEHRAHRDFAAVAPLASRVLTLADALPMLPKMPDRVVHGDPKISNLMFAHDSDKTLCLIDLDTLSRMPVALELGDALRSWCNPDTEDARHARFEPALYEAAVSGYAAASRGFLSPDEWRSIPLGTLTITVELAARFCADALNERYFGWDRTRYASASEANLARTRGQLQVAETLREALPALSAFTERVFASQTGE